MRKQRTTATIITADYGAYALALHDSLERFDEGIQLAIYISRGELEVAIQEECEQRKNIQLYFEKDIMEFPLAKDIHERYYEACPDSFRWSMKPIFMNFLLHKEFEKVIYLDSDLYFFNEYEFLWDQLERCNVLLSPHWRSSDPQKDVLNFKLNFLDGIFNGGFIGATQGGKEALEYWAQLCLFNCEVNRNEGFYVDQRYLDLLPTRFKNVDHIKHKGCNIANWNQVDCERVQQESGEVVINHNHPIVFIHFTNSFYGGVLLGTDELLLPYLKMYRDTILKYSTKDIIQDFFDKGRYKGPRTEGIKKKTENKGYLFNFFKKIKL